MPRPPVVSTGSRFLKRYGHGNVAGDKSIFFEAICPSESESIVIKPLWKITLKDIIMILYIHGESDH